MTIHATAAHWESLTDRNRPVRVRTRRTIRNERRQEARR